MGPSLARRQLNSSKWRRQYAFDSICKSLAALDENNQLLSLLFGITSQCGSLSRNEMRCDEPLRLDHLDRQLVKGQGGSEGHWTLQPTLWLACVWCVWCVWERGLWRASVRPPRPPTCGDSSSRKHSLNKYTVKYFHIYFQYIQEKQNIFK